MIRRFLSVLTLLLAAGAASAGGYGYGYSSYSYPTYYYPQSYTYAVPYGYSWYGAAIHNGYHYPAGYYAQVGGTWYTFDKYTGYTYPIGPTYVAPNNYVAPPAYGPGWQSTIIKAVDANNDRAAYLTALAKAFPNIPSFAGVYGTSAYGYGYAPAVLGTYGVSGATQYGYTVQSVNQQYGSISPDVYMQQSHRASMAALDTFREGNTLFNANITQLAGINERAVAGQNVRQIVNAIDQLLKNNATPAPATSSSVTVQQNGGGTVSAPPVVLPDNGGAAPAVAQGAAAFISSRATPRCGACHTGDKPKGGFHINMLANLDAPGKRSVMLAITNPDPTKKMPKDSGGKHVPLPPEEYLDWIKFLVN